MERIRTLIVDDEPLAREKLRTLLAGDDEIEIVGECGDGLAAAQAILENDPDLVFLDVQMPEVDGFGALDTVGGRRTPVVVFVTAYDEYALRAFDVHALDYLLKPFDRDRFVAALSLAKKRVRADRTSELGESLSTLLEELSANPKARYLDRLVVKSGGRIYFVPVDEIDWVEAAGNYAQVNVGEAKHLIRSTMKALEQKLDPAAFMRIHRSAIVNLSRIKEIHPWFNGDYTIKLTSGAEVQTGESYRSTIKQLLDNP
jgi:two-component system LytT family response regulator